jgi:HAD superfamily hydrolase (TIGR01509 family)
MKTALLFDLDGTLVDTDALHLAAFQRVFAGHGVTLTKDEYVADIMGNSNPNIGAAFLPHLTREQQEETLAAKEAAFRQALGALAPIAGLLALLDFADLLGIKCAVVTNAPRANAAVMLDALGLAGRLPLLVIGAELARAKPDPLPYLTGLEMTGAEAVHSLAFEDSLSGLAAARGAGLDVIGLTTSLASARLTSAGAAFAVADFTDPRIPRLIRQKMAYTNA